MADNSTSPGHATRTVETTRGLLTYAQLAPLLAERVLVVEERIATGDFAGTPLDGDFLLQLHQSISGDLVPDWSGRWRTVAVTVGAHEPPAPHDVRVLIRLYIDDLAANENGVRQRERGQAVNWQLNPPLPSLTFKLLALE